MNPFMMNRVVQVVEFWAIIHFICVHLVHLPIGLLNIGALVGAGEIGACF